MVMVDAGYYKKSPKLGQKNGKQYNNDWSGTWTGKDGINSLEDFVQNPKVQTQAIKDYHRIVWNRYLKNYHHLQGEVMAGVVLTKSGMVAAAYLVGAVGKKGVKTFFASKGTIVPKDSNGIPCTKYLKQFSNYEIEF